MEDTKTHRENVSHSKHMQTASQDKERAMASGSGPGGEMECDANLTATRAGEPGMDEARVASMQQIVQGTLGPESRQRVGQILDLVETLSGPEKLLLYLKLPAGPSPQDPLKQPLNPLGSRVELQQTVTWIQTHLEVDPDVSLPKQDVYDEYIAFCMSNAMKPLSTADFGKVMKQVYPTVRPRRLGTRGNSRYCYAGLRKKVKLEVPQLPELGEPSKLQETIEPTPAPTERLICDWAEGIFGLKFPRLSELARHLALGERPAPAPNAGPAPPIAPPLLPAHEDAPGRHFLKQLKRKIQSQGTPGRPKKTKAPEMTGVAGPSIKVEVGVGGAGGCGAEGEVYTAYSAPPPHPPPPHAYLPHYEQYAAPPRAHPTPPPQPPPPPSLHEYREPYAYEPTWADTLPINLSSDAAASLDLSTERHEWRRRPPEPPPVTHPHPHPQPPPPHRLPLPGKKMILEAYQHEQSLSPRPQPAPRPVPPAPTLQPLPTHELQPRTEYLPKKMRAAEILGGKLASRHALPIAPIDTAVSSPSTSSAEPTHPPDPFLEDPKNLDDRSANRAAPLVRDEDKERGARGPSSPCCGLDCIGLKTGVICEEKHHEILNRERVSSICNMDKHALDDYLNEGSSQEHEEELLQYFQRGKEPPPSTTALPPAPGAANATSHAPGDAHSTTNAPGTFLGSDPDPQDDHSQGKSDKISQLRELLAKNLKTVSGSNAQQADTNQANGKDPFPDKLQSSEPGGAFKSIARPTIVPNGNNPRERNHNDKSTQDMMSPNIKVNGDTLPPDLAPNYPSSVVERADTTLFNGHCTNVPHSPTTRTQQYDFVPISSGCQSPSNPVAKSPIVFCPRGPSPSKLRKHRSLEGPVPTSPLPHSTVASPFVSPRNTPVPRSRLCPRPIPNKINNRKKSFHGMIPLGVQDTPKQLGFIMPNDQKFIPKSPVYGPRSRHLPMSAPPSPNILSSRFKNHFQQGFFGNSNGIDSPHMSINIFPNQAYHENMNGDIQQPTSADPLSSEVSQFFHESVVPYRSDVDSSYRSQSVPLKHALNSVQMLSYNNTPVGSVPPTPVPNEFCDFGSLADTCDISKAGLNPETLDKIYDALDSSEADVLDPDSINKPLSSEMMQSEPTTNGVSHPEEQILADDPLSSLLPTEGDASNFDQSFCNADGDTEDVEDFLKRTNSIEFDLSDLVLEKNKFCSSRSVPTTPLPYKRGAPVLDPRRPRELFAVEYDGLANGISSKSVPSTPQLPDERTVFSYRYDRDYLINGNTVESGRARAGDGAGGGVVSPLHEILREEMLGPLTPAVDLLVDLDKIDPPPYSDL